VLHQHFLLLLDNLVQVLVRHIILERQLIYQLSVSHPLPRYAAQLPVDTT
jgi:hypothetical protein